MCHRKAKKTAAELENLNGTAVPKAPEGEFERIIEEMEKRGIQPAIRKELEKRCRNK